MRKIKLLFKADYEGGKGKIREPPEVTEGMEWVLAGEGEATEKVDGSACAIIGGKLYRRYDANMMMGRMSRKMAHLVNRGQTPLRGIGPFGFLLMARATGNGTRTLTSIRLGGRKMGHMRL